MRPAGRAIENDEKNARTFWLYLDGCGLVARRSIEQASVGRIRRNGCLAFEVRNDQTAVCMVEVRSVRSSCSLVYICGDDCLPPGDGIAENCADTPFRIHADRHCGCCGFFLCCPVPG